uniref:Homing endonuclease with GIY-YIG motif n=1 Tax=Serratia phage Kevin TaxID=3161161 RepID=A0AAU8KWQ7_9CAUD
MIYAYKLENTVNGRVYIGITSDPHARLNGHINSCLSGDDRLLYQAMRHHGMSNFCFEVIAQTDDDSNKWELEKQLVRQYESDIIGYNMNKGGNDASHLMGTTPARLVSTGEHIGQVSLTDPRWELCEIESVSSNVAHRFSTSDMIIKRVGGAS